MGKFSSLATGLVVKHGFKNVGGLMGGRGSGAPVIDGYLMRSWKCSRCPEWFLSGVIMVTLVGGFWGEKTVDDNVGKKY